MVRAEDMLSRIKLINIIKGTVEIAYLRLLLDYHGLQLMWSWMVEADDNELKAGILEVLEILPIPNKTMLTDSKVYSMVERWSQQSEEERSPKTGDNDQIVSQSNSQIDVEVVDKPKETPDNNMDTKPYDIVSNSTASEVAIESEIKPKEGLSELTEGQSEPTEGLSELTEAQSEPTEAQREPTEAQSELTEAQGEPREEIKSEPMEVCDEVPTTTKTDDELKPSDEAVTKVNEEEHKGDALKEEKERDENDEKNEIESTEKANKSSPRIEVRSSSLSLVIKPRSVPNTPQKEVQIAPSVNQSKPSIAAMAQKLLLNWKELKEVFRIPRLERQKRYEDEKEADRKTKEVEERRARGLPVVFDKRGVDDRDYTIAGILGIKRKGLKRPNDQKDSTNKRPSNPLSQPLSSNWKVSKEEHRKMFEMEVAQKDYQEALKRYHQELAYYNAVYGQQIQAQQQQLYSQTSVTGEQQYGYDQYYQSQSYSQNYDNYSTANEPQYQYLNAELEQPIESYENNLVEQDAIFSIETNPSLITLTNGDHSIQSESSLAIDNVANDCVVYSDSQTEINDRESLSNSTIFDPIYPPPGIFYETPDGQKFYSPFPIDRNQSGVNLVFNANVSLPLEENATKSLTTGKIASKLEPLL